MAVSRLDRIAGGLMKFNIDYCDSDVGRTAAFDSFSVP